MSLSAAGGTDPAFFLRKSTEGVRDAAVMSCRGSAALQQWQEARCRAALLAVPFSSRMGWSCGSGTHIRVARGIAEAGRES